VVLKIVRELESSGAQFDLDSLARVPSRKFLQVNRICREDIRRVLSGALEGHTIAVPRRPLVNIEEIDSFARAGEVAPQDVATIVAKILPIPERVVKAFVSEIVGEPYLDTDWGGELSDILTSRVILGGRRIDAAFLLKGSGSKRKLRPRDLGKNGDQIRRLSKQKADLFVVQHVGEFDEAVYDEVRDMVLARRMEGAEHVVGSVWDGSDCARLFLAHGLIDASTGQPVEGRHLG